MEGRAILAQPARIYAATMSTRPVRFHWEDFPEGFVAEFGGKLVDREEVLAFARQFDPQPMHLSDEAAEASLFGRLSASGWHTAAMAMRMSCDAFVLDSASLGSPGIEHIKWLKPVYPGDVLRVRFEVLEARPMKSRPGVGLIKSRWEVLNQDRETVMTMEGWGMYGQRGETALA